MGSDFPHSLGSTLTCVGAGFHATDAASFAEALHAALTLPKAEALAMRERARAWAVKQFSEAEFERGWEASGWRAFVR